MAVRTMAGVAIACPSAFDIGHSRITPKLGDSAHRNSEVLWLGATTAVRLLES